MLSIALIIHKIYKMAILTVLDYKKKENREMKQMLGSQIE